MTRKLRKKETELSRPGNDLYRKVKKKKEKKKRKKNGSQAKSNIPLEGINEASVVMCKYSFSLHSMIRSISMQRISLTL